MKVVLTHKIALDPTDRQRTYFAKACGTARFAYNWALAEWNRQYKSGEKPNTNALRRQLNALKRDQFPWMMEVAKEVPESGIINLGTAFSRFFAKLARYPRFKKKGKRDSFSVRPDQILTEGRRIRIPRLGWVCARESLRFVGRICRATASRTADRWFISIAVETQVAPSVRENQVAVGVDLGITTMATLSTGEKIAGPQPHRALHRRMVRLNRSLHRKVKGSRNRWKAKQKMSRLHARIGNIRVDSIHKETTSLCRRFGVIGIEDLNVDGMLRNRRLARSIGDVGMSEFRRQIEYKAQMHGIRVAVAGRFYPSTKTCSACGVIADAMPLKVRDWTCTHCGAVHDRDVNAAINLRNIAAGSAVTACGPEGSGVGLVSADVKPAGMKQEPDTFVELLFAGVEG